MTKHDNYSNQCIITITKYEDLDGKSVYTLTYGDEDWSFSAYKDEILDELSEHLELMTTNKGE